MAVDLTNITKVSLDGDGIFDVLMRTLRLHMVDSMEKSELTQSQVGAIYSSTLPSIIQEALQYDLQRQTTEQQLQTVKFERDLALYKAHLESVVSLYSNKQLDEISEKVVGIPELEELYSKVKAARELV